MSPLPAAVDAMVMQIPIALAIGALPALVRLIPATVRVIRRRIRTIEVAAGFATPASAGVAAID